MLRGFFSSNLEDLAAENSDIRTDYLAHLPVPRTCAKGHRFMLVGAVVPAHHQCKAYCMCFCTGEIKFPKYFISSEAIRYPTGAGVTKFIAMSCYLLTSCITRIEEENFNNAALERGFGAHHGKPAVPRCGRS